MSKQTMRYLVAVPVVMPFAILAYFIWSCGLILTAAGEWSKDRCEDFAAFLFKMTGCCE